MSVATIGLTFSSDLAQRLSAVKDIEPAALADLFRLASSENRDAIAVRHALQTFLLGRTLEHAREHTHHYKAGAYSNWTSRPSCSAPSLDGLPLLRRESVAAHTDDFLADDVTVRSLCHTSGVSGPPLDIYKSHQEISFIQAFYKRLFEPVMASLPLRPLTLTLPNFYHGVPVPMPSIGLTFIGGVTDDTLIKDACRVLRSKFNLKGYDTRISMLSGLSFHVLLLTSYLMEQGITPRELGLKCVTSTGGFLPLRWVRFLEDAWGCLVNDRFTLTEAIGGASRIYGSDIFELDPNLIGEVVDPDTECRTDNCVGLLALTSLYPFVQMQPLIRYATGDLIRKIPSPNAFRFQFLGKEANCISWTPNGRREWLLFSSRLNELLHDLPDCNVYDWFCNVRVVSDRSFGSQPLQSVVVSQEGSQLLIRISIELRYAPHTRQSRLEELRSMISQGLRMTPDTALSLRMDRSEVQLKIDFVGPGALKAPLLVKM